ncbi:MAG: LytTR family DNA-binding domain-containing protein [Sphingorhabdus sp.]
MSYKRFGIFIFLVFSMLPSAAAEAMSWFDTDKVVVCPAVSDDLGPPDFSSPECRAIKGADIDPQNDMIWLKTNIHLDNIAGPKGEPLALFVSGKMSSEIYLNGKLVGRNGKPGQDTATETPGQMDATLYPLQSLFKKGNNKLVLKASSHHGFLKLRNPVHILAIGPSGTTTDYLLRHYWPSLLTLGLFILGALYFGIAGLIGPNRKKALTFCLICIFAAGQLLAEVYRGIIGYSYPAHDLRLILITFCSAGFGLTVAYHVLSSFIRKHLGIILAAIAAISAVGIFCVEGFDTKSEWAILLPLAASLLATGIWSYQRRPRAFVYFLILLVFVAAVLIFRSLFLDVVFFYLVAMFLLFLFVEQGVTLAREAREHAIETARANRLELALEQARERQIASEINVKSAGKMERISTGQISHCRGASGYAEIILLDGREILHSATLAEMEETLPATFLRVHRSYLVNTAYVKSLERDPSGTGTLSMTDGSDIPVSRRILPQVRQALN